ncbi:hypothetical protein CC80DRAFT_496513 [Byssothecium circinans]|uniref:Uncharacterized protein n=1 Tax=Byssothecium circinans TaxID=147558 RepID=A0A6A5TGL5_9PLEO|nr:hypothetical protein CC80DRAFT_496513 [Byssothecium circinans]
MPLNSESIIGLITLLVACPPTLYWLYKLATRSSIHQESYLPLHCDYGSHRQPSEVRLQRHETWSCYTNIVMRSTDCRQKSMTDGGEMPTLQEGYNTSM